MNGELQSADTLWFRFLSAKCVSYNVGLSWVILDCTIIIVQKFYPATLSHIQILLVVNMLKAPVVGIKSAFSPLQVMPPDFECKY
ncbi:hypothetical protein Hanom_Chr13g01202661 [Helianthus anomalus]